MYCMPAPQGDAVDQRSSSSSSDNNPDVLEPQQPATGVSSIDDTDEICIADTGRPVHTDLVSG